MSRIPTVDVCRAAAILAVIVIHTEPFGLDAARSTLTLGTAINQGARFVVPFFFVIAGYFWGRDVDDTASTNARALKTLRRNAYLLAGWSLIYLLPWDIAGAFDLGWTGPLKIIYWRTADAVLHPATTLLEGTQPHLWFLVALSCCIAIAAPLITLGQTRLLVVVAVLCYAVGLAGGAYRDSPFGFHSTFNFRNGPFFALIFFVTGVMLRRLTPSTRWLGWGLAMTAIGVATHLFEIVTLHSTFGTSMNQDYVVGTYLSGTGVAVAALSNSRALVVPLLARIGPAVPGIYLSHMIFVDLLRPFDRLLNGNALWEPVYPLAVFALSYWLSRALWDSASRRLVE